GELLVEHRVAAEVVDARAAVARRQPEAEQAELAGLEPHLPIDGALPAEALVVGRHGALHPLPHGGAQVVVQVLEDGALDGHQRSAVSTRADPSIRAPEVTTATSRRGTWRSPARPCTCSTASATVFMPWR